MLVRASRQRATTTRTYAVGDVAGRRVDWHIESDGTRMTDPKAMAVRARFSGRFYCVAMAARLPRSTNFWILPVAVFGSSSTT